MGLGFIVYGLGRCGTATPFFTALICGQLIEKNGPRIRRMKRICTDLFIEIRFQRLLIKLYKKVPQERICEVAGKRLFLICVACLTLWAQNAILRYPLGDYDPSFIHRKNAVNNVFFHRKGIIFLFCEFITA